MVARYKQLWDLGYICCVCCRALVPLKTAVCSNTWGMHGDTHCFSQALTLGCEPHDLQPFPTRPLAIGCYPYRILLGCALA